MATVQRILLVYEDSVNSLRKSDGGALIGFFLLTQSLTPLWPQVNHFLS